MSVIPKRFSIKGQRLNASVYLQIMHDASAFQACF